ncbi:hypothetical protein [Haloplanus halophilus]|uniref:hypothetical protein n=1 Tax=Haloplanus halophilus TaxID=2949993 RepID=UPI0020406FFF|nr:hypothetical protein [Haloplanus sp. GDY1]
MTEEKTVSLTDGGCYAGGTPSVPVAIRAGELAPSPIDVAAATDDATLDTKGGNTVRGQEVEKCPTDPLPLHANTTGNELDVSGDLVIAANSCPVQFSFGPNRSVRFPPGANFGITVEVSPGHMLVGQCIPDPSREHDRCEWSFTRTSP